MGGIGRNVSYLKLNLL